MTRKHEKSCKHDSRFMYLLERKKAPDHNRFWHFIKTRLTDTVMQGLQSQLVFYLEGAGELLPLRLEGGAPNSWLVRLLGAGVIASA